MKITPTFGSPRSQRTKLVAWAAALMTVAMLLAQLFGFEDFATTLAAVLPFNDLPMTTATAAGVVLAELLTLPYLLGMYISKLMRIVSALAGAVISLFWLILSLTNSHAQNSGIFSTTLELPGGLIAAAWALVLFGCVARVIVVDSRFRHATAS